jgi:hypothetical protein
MTVRVNVIEFQALAGGVDVPLPDVGWVPIAAVFSRSNGATDPADVCDMRPLAGDQAASSDGEEIMLTHNLRSRFGFPTDVPSSFLMSVDVDLYDRGGRRMFARATSDTSEMDLTALFSPGLSLTNSTWFYLYLCRWGSKYTPRGAYAGVTSQGILVVSDVAPSVQGRRDNSAPITLPSPWATVPVPIGEAVCIGALASDPSNAAGLGFRGMSVSNGRVRSLELPFSVASLFGPAAFLTAAILPKNARGFVPRAKCDGVSPGGVVLKVQWPNVSPTRQMHWTLSRENATLNQITTYFDCRGVPVTQIWCASDPGFTYCDIYEMEI